MIQTQLHCLYILGWLLPSSGFLLVNTEEVILQNEKEKEHESKQLVENSN